MIEKYRSPWFNLQGYKACTVIFANGKRKTILEHREIVERCLGRKLNSKEIIHHKDGNKCNNTIANLEITSQSKHAKMHSYSGGPEILILKCIRCKVQFKRLARHERHNRKQCKRGPFCGRSCAAKKDW